MRLQYVDAIRGLAALGVAFFHFVHYLADTRSIAAPAGLYAFVIELHLGIFCVMVFFVVSGFVIPPSITSVRSFVMRRFFRLYPTYWLALVFSALVSAALVGGFDAGTFIANTTMVHGFLGYRDINGVAWTLQIELVFYALCVALFAAGLLHNTAILLALALTCTVIAGLAVAPYYLMGGLALMFAGSLLRRLTPRGDIYIPVLPWLGEISYQIYLMHLPLNALLHLMKRIRPVEAFFEVTPPSLLIAAFLSLLVLLSWLVHRYLEVPCIRLGAVVGVRAKNRTSS